MKEISVVLNHQSVKPYDFHNDRGHLAYYTVKKAEPSDVSNNFALNMAQLRK